MWQEESFEEPWRDTIVEEIREVRQQHAARFNHDLDAIAADFKSREQEGPYKVVSLPPRRLPAVDRPGS
jgi:hypothetical protein